MKASYSSHTFQRALSKSTNCAKRTSLIGLCDDLLRSDFLLVVHTTDFTRYSQIKLLAVLKVPGLLGFFFMVLCQLNMC